jgi:PAS domain-containing protein
MTNKPVDHKLKDVPGRQKKQLRFLTSAFEQSSEGMAVVDLQGRLMFVNRAFAEAHGFTQEELAGRGNICPSSMHRIRCRLLRPLTTTY